MSSASLKKLGVLAGLLVLLWIAYLYRMVPHSQAPFAKAETLAQRVALEQGPKKIELLKKGKDWQVSSGDGSSSYPVEECRVKSLLVALKNVQVEDEISDRADRAADYEVNAGSGTCVRLFDAKGTKLAEGLFGKQSPDSSHIYFRYLDKPNVYLVRGIIRGELGPVDIQGWRTESPKSPPSPEKK
jgi:hypothetical protein